VKDELRPVMRAKYPNSSLLLRFTDIDLAGRYSTARNARVISSGHPARMSFDFVLADANGKVLAKGSTRLTDNSNP
jgi:disulfide oxidoreductase YuzD